MCGISVIVTKNRDYHDKIDEMSNRAIHRGPDASGVYDSSVVSMAHRRLKIIDLSESADQPMCHDDGITIVFNGEIYNYKTIREQLIENGYRFETDSDTEVILNLYRASFSPVQMLEKLNGMFAFVIYDVNTREIIAARDRFGIKPLYYTHIDGGYAFASEIKQFAALPGWSPKLNQDMANEFLVGGMVDHKHGLTIFEGVYQVEPGQFVRIDIPDPTLIEKYQWYNLRHAISLAPTTSTFLTTQWLLKSSVETHLQADVPVGSCLSGGIDSTSIVCLINRIKKNQKLVTVSSRSTGEFDEGKWIDIVERFCTLIDRHDVFPEIEDLFSRHAHVVYHQDSPIPSTSMFAQHRVFEEASKHVKVMLDGQGADEIFGGYHMYFGSRFATLLRSGKLYTLMNEFNAARKIPGFDPTFVMKCAVGQTYRGINSIFDYSYEQVTRTSLPALLHWEDRNSMAHSVEARVPFLDHKLVEYTMALPDEKKVSGGMTKVMLREAMTDLIPHEIVTRKDKIGFQTPESYWFDHRRDMFKAKYDLAKPHIPQTMKSSCDDILAKRKPYTSELWRAISYGEFLKCWMLE